MAFSIEKLSEEDREFINTEVRAAFPEMVTHAEIFTLPSGKEIWVYCDGRVCWDEASVEE